MKTEINIDYTKMDTGKIEKWFETLWEHSGFQEYVKFRDLQLLKAMGTGLEEREYMKVCGKREELLTLAGKAKEYWEKINKPAKIDNKK